MEFERNWELHTAGTCEWILNTEMFKSWTVGEVEVLLVNGIPGKFTLLFSYIFYIRATPDLFFLVIRGRKIYPSVIYRP